MVNKQIECQAFLGGTKIISRDRLAFRPSVYGLVVHEGEILLVNTIAGGRYSLPGGGLDAGEPLVEALRREVREETGIETEVGDFAGFKEEFFYYDPLDVAFHSFLFYYRCRPLSLDLAADQEVDDDAVDRPQWVAIGRLRPADFHQHGEQVLGLLTG